MSNTVSLTIGRKKIDFLPVLYAILMAPFFEPLSISTFINEGINASFWNLIATLYSLARLAVSSYVYLRIIYAWKKAKTYFSKIVLCGIIFLIMQVLSCILNKTFTANLFLGLYSYAGFVLLCIEIQRKSQPLFFKTVIVLFAVLSFIGVFTTFLFPNGFNHASIKAYAHYALGSKNSSFFYFFSLLFSWSVYSMLYKHKLPAWSGVCLLILIAAAAVCNSGNSIICLTLILLCNYLENHGKWLFRYVKPKLLLSVLIAIVIIVYMGLNLPILNAIVGSVGRDSSFTGRDALWANAIRHFVSSPIWGTGQDAIFLLSYGAEATHAHSFYLDMLAKHGLITAIPLFASLIYAINHTVRLKNRLLSNQIGIYVFVAMLHMVFDVPGNYFYLLVLMIVNAVSMVQRDALRRKRMNAA